MHRANYYMYLYFGQTTENLIERADPLLLWSAIADLTTSEAIFPLGAALRLGVVTLPVPLSEVPTISPTRRQILEEWSMEAGRPWKEEAIPQGIFNTPLALTDRDQEQDAVESAAALVLRLRCLCPLVGAEMLQNNSRSQLINRICQEASGRNTKKVDI